MQYIHLLYVPTMACNMQCRYCYLEDQPAEPQTAHDALGTLAFAVEKFREAEVAPFNISLHGGEVTTLAPEVFRSLIGCISDYYARHGTEIREAGFPLGSPHIKTNLYGLDRHIDTIREFQVSVSGSLDLPFSLHDAYRVTRGGEPTLDKILKNTALMAQLPNRKKVSATIFRQHYERIDEIIEDIWTLHRETCLDMNNFNFMIGFEYNSRGLLTALTQEEQVDFYRRIREAFQGTELNPGLEGPWFAEFGPDYCTNCDVCGEKFFLLERSGDIYSCVRGQGHPEFFYGNIYQDSVAEILDRAGRKIRAAHQAQGFDPACAGCGYLYLCKTGCPFVKSVYHSPRSYTCLLQQALYADHGLEKDPYPEDTAYRYLANVQPDLMQDYAPPRIPAGVPPLQQMIRRDPHLRCIYDPEAFILTVDGEEFALQSQILRTVRDYACITPESRVFIDVRKDVMEAECAEPVNNALYIQVLSGDYVQYGDEGRSKQKHIMNEMIYLNVLERQKAGREGYYRLDISHIFRRYGDCFSREEANNLFFTTAALRETHYAKQKNNAFYHMQAMDLPFQNIEFYYLSLMEEEKQDGSDQNL